MKKLRFQLLISIAVCASLRAQTTFNPVPTRIFGQPINQQQGTLTSISPNLVEGRELDAPQAVAIDTSATPPILYVADTVNNRVLAFKNAAGFTKRNFADKVIGQRDFFTTAAKGPGTDLTSGLSQPVGLVVDKNGNLYVIDAGNNRIVRYPAPFKQTSVLLTIDLVLGQLDLNSKLANQGQQNPSASTLAFSSGSTTLLAGLAFDATGNLWVSDALNNRVLRFPAAALATGAKNDPAADMVLGQSGFTTNALPTGTAFTQVGKNFLDEPADLGFDPEGRLFVPDLLNRVLVYVPPFSIGQTASRIMGVVLPTQQVPHPPAISESTLNSPNGVFFAGDNPFVLDTRNNRILEYMPFDQWAAEGTTFSPPAIAVTGQSDFVSSTANRGQAQSSAASLAGPVSAVFFNSEMYLADAGNNRVMVFPQQSGNFSSATRLVGQVDFQYNSINLIEGRELFLFAGIQSGSIVGGGIAVIDSKSNPPHLYVSDPLNNRVLGFKDYRKVNAGVTADLVIGQPNLFTAETDYPTNDSRLPTASNLSFPQGLAVDTNGNLYVADTGNGRVLRFPQPFAQPNLQQEEANLVIGQTSFFTKVTDASSQNMRSPWGIAFTQDGYLLVSDLGLNRMLFFLKPSNGDFVNGQPATSVIGQPDFSTINSGELNGPRLISTDTDDHVYLADTGNNRILVYPNLKSLGNDPQPSFAITTGLTTDGLRNPNGVWVSPATGVVWVADTLNNRLLQYPRFEQLVANPSANTALSSALPLSVSLDPFDNPISAEGGTNRIAFFSPAIDPGPSAGGVAGRFSGNAANYLGRFTPGMLASIFAFTTSRFGDQTVVFNSLPHPLPIPTTLGDVQVLVGGTASPLLYVSPSQINLQIPNATPVGPQPAEIRVVRASTGDILASGLFTIGPASPGLFTTNSTGSGQIAALNQDNTVNGASSPAKAGSVIQLFGTGTGALAGAPPDGSPAQGLIRTAQLPSVFINDGFIPSTDVLYSGLAPGFIGVWQINARVPMNAPPGDVPVVIVFEGINSNLDQFGDRRITTIRTTP